jgi:hypothetical protein
MRGGERRRRIVAELEARDGDRCYYCGNRFRVDVPGLSCTVDHIVALSRGGTNALVNLRLACAHCNQRKGALEPGVYEASTELRWRQRRALRDELVGLGLWLPKHRFYHRDIAWIGEMRWTCGGCGQASLDGTLSPARVPCLRKEDLADYGAALLSPNGEWLNNIRGPILQS